MKKGLIQVAGIIDQTEATLITDCSADYVGFPLRLDVHEEDLSEIEAASIIRSLPSKIRSCLITYLDDAAAIVELSQSLACTVIQLHGDICRSELARLRSRSPRIEIIKSLVVGDTNQFAELAESIIHLSPYVDAFITDTFDPDTGASGATGKTHDWTISQRLVEVSRKPVILAGGLTPANVGEAIHVVRPAGVDVHTGVENGNGWKNRRLVTQFIQEARNAFAAVHACSENLTQRE
jgi:phosphoribosylanthranilate isomerase